jgi:hypothetical protein
MPFTGAVSWRVPTLSHTPKETVSTVGIESEITRRPFSRVVNWIDIKKYLVLMIGSKLEKSSEEIKN